jgi:RecA/RadA recombinase
MTGGVWRGHIFNIEGPEKSGKSSLLYTILSKLIANNNFKVGLVDAEGSLDETFMTNLGLINSPNFRMIKVIGSGEQALQGIHKVILSGKFDAIAIDSFAAFVPEKLIDNDSAGQYARMLSKYIGAISQAALATHTVIIGSNQIRTDLSGFHPRNIATGGNSLRHFSSTRISMSAKETEQFFQFSLAKCHKSKNHIPNREMKFKVFYGKGIDEGYDRVEVGLLLGIITEDSKGWLEYSGTKQADHNKKYRRHDLELLLAHNDPKWSLEELSKENSAKEEMLPTQMLESIPFITNKEEETGDSIGKIKAKTTASDGNKIVSYEGVLPTNEEVKTKKKGK